MQHFKNTVQRSDVHRVVVVALESWRCSLGPGGQFMQSHRDLVLCSSLAMMVLSISTRNFGHWCSGMSESIKPLLVWKPNSLFFSPSEGRCFVVKLCVCVLRAAVLQEDQMALEPEFSGTGSSAALTATAGVGRVRDDTYGAFRGLEVVPAGWWPAGGDNLEELVLLDSTLECLVDMQSFGATRDRWLVFVLKYVCLE